jgi:hypothetical protein
LEISVMCNIAREAYQQARYHPGPRKEGLKTVYKEVLSGHRAFSGQAST